MVTEFIHRILNVVPESWYRQVSTELAKSTNKIILLEARINSLVEEKELYQRKAAFLEEQNYKQSEINLKKLAPIAIAQKSWGQRRKELEQKHKKEDTNALSS